MDSRSLSVKDIAELAGVSVATVSRVINQNGRFSKETERRVRKVIEDHNYKPNLIARGLRTNKLPIIGAIVPDITNEFFATITLALQKSLFAANYSTIICNTNELYDIELQHLMMLRAQQVSGLVCITGNPLEPSTLLDVPTIFIDRDPALDNSSGNYLLIESDNRQGARLAVEELVRSGSRRIAIIEFQTHISTHQARYEGYRQALEDNGLKLREEYCCVAPDACIASGYAYANRLMQLPEPPDGIFCTTDHLAIGALRALEEREIPVPGRVRLVGFDDIPLSGLTSVPITTIRQAPDEFGALAAEMLISMIDGQKPATKHFLFPTKLIRRATT